MNTKSPVTAPAESMSSELQEKIRHVLRISFVPDYMRVLARWPMYAEAVIDAIGDAVGTSLFSGNSGQLRWLATVVIGDEFGVSLPSNLLSFVDLSPAGKSEVVRILDFYDYLLPRLMLINSALYESLEGAPVGQVYRHSEDELAMESLPDFTGFAVPLTPDDAPSDVVDILSSVASFLHYANPPDEILSLARYPVPLKLAWSDIEPVICTEPFAERTSDMAREAIAAAHDFPSPVMLNKDRLADIGIGDDDREYIGRLLNDYRITLAWRSIMIAGFRWALENRQGSV